MDVEVSEDVREDRRRDAVRVVDDGFQPRASNAVDVQSLEKTIDIGFRHAFRKDDGPDRIVRRPGKIFSSSTATIAPLEA